MAVLASKAWMARKSSGPALGGVAQGSQVVPASVERRTVPWVPETQTRLGVGAETPRRSAGGGGGGGPPGGGGGGGGGGAGCPTGRARWRRGRRGRGG
jgi:hypothetical protein